MGRHTGCSGFGMTARATQHKSPETFAHLVSLLRAFDSATFVTRSRAGSLHGRPMSIARVDDDVTIWFITSAASAKIDEVAEDGRALVTLQSGSRFACLSGNAELVFDPRQLQELWKDQHRVWLEGASDSEIILVRFISFEAEYWDHSGLASIKHALQAARAYVSGGKSEMPSEPSDVQGHARIKLWDPSAH